jgi:hypothetical protein
MIYLIINTKQLEVIRLIKLKYAATFCILSWIPLVNSASTFFPKSNEWIHL